MLRRLTRTQGLRRALLGSTFTNQGRWTSSLLESSIRDFVDLVVSRQPVFKVSPSSIRILTRPAEFYKILLDMIGRAEKRIFLSSLYLGAEETELIAALAKRLRERPDLHLTLLLDLNRSTRPSPDSTALLLTPLIRAFENRVHVSMFRSPYLRGILSKLIPPRYNEGWGTWHAKIYGADDDVIISGANLNKSYFSNRQDRYIQFRGHKSLAQYCFDFVETTRSFSYRLLPHQEPYLSASNPYSYVQEGYTLQWPLSDTHPHHFNSLAEHAFTSLQKSYREQLSMVDEEGSSQSVLLIPIIQGGQFNIKEEEWIIYHLFSSLKRYDHADRPLMDLTSGYFSLYKPYQDLILNSPGIDCRIVAAGPKANGFYGSKGISGRIPEAYTLFEQKFMSAVYKAGRSWHVCPDTMDSHGVSLSEWEKPGWTYHAKGIWLSPGPSALPFLTLFGSTNLNSRSAHIDTELSFVMILPQEGQPTSSAGSLTSSTPVDDDTDCLNSLRQELAKEVNGIRSNASEWKGESRKVRWSTKSIVWLLKGML